jgi:hypothetical protein
MDLSRLSLLRFVAVLFAVAFLVNIAQCVIYVRQGSIRAASRRHAKAHPTLCPRRVALVQTAFYATLVISSSTYFVESALVLRVETSGFDSSPYANICFGRVGWFLFSTSALLGTFSDMFLLLLLDYIFAATLNGIGLAGHSRKIQVEQSFRDVARLIALLIWLLSIAADVNDVFSIYSSAADDARQLGCLPVTRDAILSPFALDLYIGATFVTWVYLACSLLLLLTRNARVARDARRHHLPTYELYRAALGRIRLIILSNLAALFAIYLLLAFFDLDDDRFLIPTNLSYAAFNVIYFAYYVVNGFAFLRRRPKAHQATSVITSPMMAAMDASCTSTAHAFPAV